jgi:Arc/MetJ-type ribon-helix-helix transcriptional regulator
VLLFAIIKQPAKEGFLMGKKATFVLDDQVMAEAKMIVEKGFYKSMNAFVESAIRDEIEKNKRELIRAAIIEASKDPLFLSDIEEVEKDFEYADFLEVDK